MPGIVILYDRASSKQAQLSKNGDNISQSLFRSDCYNTKKAVEEYFYLQLNLLEAHQGNIFQTNEYIIGWFGNLWYNGEKFTQKLFYDIQRHIRETDIKQVLVKFEGQYQLIIYDRVQKKVNIISDKVGSHPFYYFHYEGQTIVSPEILSLRGNLPKSVNIRKEAVYEFLMSGHLWGNGTFVNGIEKLGPGQFLSIDSSGLSKQFYYKPDYSGSNHNVPIEELNTSLYQAIHKDLDKLPGGKKILTLSGGWDSRLLLGFLRERGESFEAVSYSYGKNAHHKSDGSVAQSIADQFNVPFKFYQSNLDNGEKVLNEIGKVIQATGGECDLAVSQEAILGSSFYKWLGEDYRMLLRGDEMWEGGDYAVNATMAFIENWLFVPEELNVGDKLLKKDRLSEASNYLKNQRINFSKEWDESNVYNDLRHFLAWRHRKPRLLHNIAYLRKCYLMYQAPFIYENTVNSVLQVPSKYMLNKVHLKIMAKRYFPSLFSDIQTSTSYKKGPNKFDELYTDRDIISNVRKHIIGSPPEIFKQLFDSEELEKFLENTLSSKNTSNQKRAYNVKRYLNSLLRKSKYLPGIAKYSLKKLDKFHFPVVSTAYLFRVFALARALKEYEDF